MSDSNEPMKWDGLLMWVSLVLGLLGIGCIAGAILQVIGKLNG